MWSKRQKMIYSALRTRLSVWAACDWSVQWVNLTSAPTSDATKLMAHFQELRRRMERRLGVSVEYAGVRTSEGHGVVHVLMAAKVQRGKAWSTVCSQRWLSGVWGQMHGAPIVWIKGVELGVADRFRLSKYMVTQYMAHGQGDALERFFQSRQRAWQGIQIAKLRRDLWRAVGHEWKLMDPDRPEVNYGAKLVTRVKLFRAKWDELLARRCVDFDGRQFVGLPEGLVEV